ncbi:putative Glucanase B [Seiridium cardinale]|uniref:Glucanase B n=1 Tax=Seiridium cardinale TaxID=138064 RepID=A0ABR2Y9C9_9PEZI
MRVLSEFLFPSLALFSALGLALPLVAQPSAVKDIVITEDNTVNSTNIASVDTVSTVGASSLQISITNNNAGSGALTAYVTGSDVSGSVVFLSPSGSWYYPDAAGSTTPIQVLDNVALELSGVGGTTTFTLPGYISAARIWVSEAPLEFFTVSSGGTTQLVEPSFANPADPSATINWGFVELTYNMDGIWANLSFVDFVGLVMGMSLTLGSGEVQTRKGLKSGAIAGICSDLAAQSAIDGQPWKDLCVTDEAGAPLRILAPNLYAGLNSGAFGNYFSDYIDQVWSQYTSQDLTIDSQSSPGLVGCTISGDNLFCANDNRNYGKPTTQDIFGCNSGPFAIIDGDNDVHKAVVPRLCAAFNRGTLFSDGGNIQPSLSSDFYYLSSPNNHYSRIVHSYESDGLGYAFSYDDVNPDGENQAGLVAGADPQLLHVVVGGIS